MGIGPRAFRGLVIAGGIAAAVAGVAGATGPQANSWRTGPSMNAARAGLAIARLGDGRILVAGGDSTQKGVEIYSPQTNAWTAKASMNASREGPVAVTLNSGKVLVAGPDTSAEVYDPNANTWTPTTNAMAAGRGFYSEILDPYQIALLPSGDVLLAGGNSAASKAVDLYDPTDNSFHSKAPMGTAREYSGEAVLPGGKVLVAGGYDGTNILASGEVYDPGHNTWAPVANSMGIGHVSPIMAELPGGKVLIAGGLAGGGSTPAETTEAEIYDPATNRFSPTGSMITGSFFSEAASLPDGRVVVAGGASTFTPGSFTADTSAQVYQPRTGTWVATPNLPVANLAGAAAALPDGSVMVTGGSPDGHAATAATLIYTPATAPGAPQSVRATPGNRQAVVTWRPPSSSGGSPVLGYTVIASAGRIHVTAVSTGTTAVVTGLPNGKSVTFRVTASNGVGTGPASAASPAVVPLGPVSVKVSGLKPSMKLRSFLAGVSAKLTPNEPCRLTVQLLGTASQATIAAAYNLILATRSYGTGTVRKVKLKPNRGLIGGATHFKVELLVTATTSAGFATTLTRTIRVG